MQVSGAYAPSAAKTTCARDCTNFFAVPCFFLHGCWADIVQFFAFIVGVLLLSARRPPPLSPLDSSDDAQRLACFRVPVQTLSVAWWWNVAHRLLVTYVTWFSTRTPARSHRHTVLGRVVRRLSGVLGAIAWHVTLQLNSTSSALYDDGQSQLFGRLAQIVAHAAAVSLVWAGITHGWFVRCAACWCRLINGKPSATIETQTSMGARVQMPHAAATFSTVNILHTTPCASSAGQLHVAWGTDAVLTEGTYLPCCRMPSARHGSAISMFLSWRDRRGPLDRLFEYAASRIWLRQNKCGHAQGMTPWRARCWRSRWRRC